jgi:hypothetical protein
VALLLQSGQKLIQQRVELIAVIDTKSACPSSQSSKAQDGLMGRTLKNFERKKRIDRVEWLWLG